MWPLIWRHGSRVRFGMARLESEPKRGLLRGVFCQLAGTAVGRAQLSCPKTPQQLESGLAAVNCGILPAQLTQLVLWEGLMPNPAVGILVMWMTAVQRLIQQATTPNSPQHQSPIAQLVEQAAVNRFVLGSSPSRGALSDRGNARQSG